MSGYLITSINLAEKANGSFSLSDFWIKRIRRLFPALFFMIFVLLSVFLFLLLPEDLERMCKSVIAVLCLVSNWFFLHQSGYFAPSSDEQFLLHTWSLSVEEQFYIILPVMIWFLNKQQFKAFVIVLALCSFGACLIMGLHNQEVNYFLLTTRAWELFFGCIIACWEKEEPKYPYKKIYLTSFLPVLILLFIAFYYNASTPFPGIFTVPVILATGFIIYFGGKMPGSFKILEVHPLVFIGKISYSFYLWHWPVFALFYYFSYGPSRWYIRVLLVVVAFLLSCLSFYFIEQPFRKNSLIITNKKMVIFYIASLFVGLGVSYFGIYSAGVRFSINHEVIRLLDSLNFADGPRLDVIGDPKKIKPLFKNGGKNVVLWGDSHAGHFVPGIVDRYKDSKCSFYYYGLGCAPPIADYARGIRLTTKNETIAYTDKVLDYLIANQSLDSIILAGFWESCDGDITEILDGFEKVCSKLNDANKKVYFVMDVPRFSVSPVKFVRRRNAFGISEFKEGEISVSEYNRSNLVQSKLLAVAEKYNVKILDPSSKLLNREFGNKFSIWNNSGLVYFDDNHLNIAGSIICSGVFNEVFEQYGK